MQKIDLHWLQFFLLFWWNLSCLLRLNCLLKKINSDELFNVVFFGGFFRTLQLFVLWCFWEFRSFAALLARVFCVSLYVKISQILEVFCVYDSFISVYLIDWCVCCMFVIIDIFFVLFSESELRREISRLGTTTARLKPKGIDGGLHKRWSMWFNSTQRAKPYQFLT